MQPPPRRLRGREGPAGGVKEGRDRRHSDEVFDLLELDDTTTGGGIRWIHRRLEDDDEHGGQRDRPRI